MPFTPYHFGPGVLLKSVAPKSISLSAFIVSQVAIDVEVLSNIINNKRPLHGINHIGIVGTGIGLVVGVLVYGAWRIISKYFSGKDISKYNSDFSLKSVLLGGIIGGSSHVLLDSMLYDEVLPFWPVVNGNPLLGLLSYGVVYNICTISGVIGVLFLFIRAKYFVKTG